MSIHQDESELKNSNEIKREPENRAVIQNPGSMQTMMKQAEEIEKNTKNWTFSFKLYNQAKSRIEVQYKFCDFKKLDIPNAFKHLKYSAIEILSSIQNRMIASDPNTFEINERHKIEFTSNNNGTTYAFGIMMVSSKDGVIYVKYAGINKVETIKAKRLIKLGGYSLGAISFGLTAFILANSWTTKRENAQLKATKAARDHELQKLKMEQQGIGSFGCPIM
mmetsp:Transcript_35851/g.44261  ORF Transcript_35851/g.44261 Transcript_35851/m.44261 type:complete len:221 (-) Transcript_35851:94-756(-)